MKIAIALTGRSHLLNVAESLIECGHDVVFYTCIPKSRCKKFGLDPRRVVSFFPIWGWLFIYRKIKKPGIRNRILSALDYLVDFSVSLVLKKCDVFIGASTVTVRSARAARRKYHAVVICDCGTKHVIKQNSVLQNLPNAQKIYKTTIERELMNYEQADYITVPSEHAFRSFVEQGVDRDKLFINPYGANLSLFSPTVKPAPENSYDVLVVGAWRYIKGVDLLVSVCEEMGLTLLHVGSVFANCPFPKSDRFTHIDAVDETKLIDYYARAKIFVFPSRADGFGLVIIQAIIAGLPIVYSKDTGGSDLKKLLDPEKEFMFEMESFSSESLKACIDKAMTAYRNQPDDTLRRNVTEEQIQRLSWDRYGRQYDNFFKQITTR